MSMKTIKVEGLSVQDILNKYNLKDLSEIVNGKAKVSTSDIRALTTRLVSASNKRLKRIAEAGLTTPTVESHTLGGVTAKTKGGTEYKKLSTKGKSRAELITTFQNAKKILTLETASVRGARKFVEKEYKRRTGIDLSKFTLQEQRNYWKLVERIKEVKSFARKSYTSNDALEIVEMVLNEDNNAGLSYDELEKKLMKQLGLGYEQAQETRVSNSTEFTIES